MDALVQFLRDRLNEDEQAARRAGDTFRQIGETGVIVATEGDRAEECASANWAGIAEHIVRHDPARVLREVAAKRELLDDYERFVAERRRMMNGWDSYPEPSPVLTAFAAVYADHPDYRDAWRP
jgi:hypothetical protein